MLLVFTLAVLRALFNLYGLAISLAMGRRSRGGGYFTQIISALAGIWMGSGNNETTTKNWVGLF
jgi:hypothetical protein